MRELPSATFFSTFLCKQKNQKIKKSKKIKKEKKKKKYIYIYIYEKVDWKPEKAVYAKGEQKKKHEKAC